MIENEMGRRFARIVVAAAMAVPAVGLFTAGPAGATVPACGSTITKTTALTADMTCPGDGLFIGASNITLDLRGHTMTGPGPDVRPAPNQIFAGVRVTSGRTGVRVVNGTIRAFTIGVTTQVGANGNEISDLMLAGNGQGILTQASPTTGATSDSNSFRRNTVEGSTGANGPAVRLQGNGHVFENNTVRDNRNSGISVTGDDNHIEGNQISGHPFLGIDMRGSQDGTTLVPERNSLARNRVWGNGATAIIVNGDGNHLFQNILSDNRGNGIAIGGPTSPRQWVGNRIEGNTVSGSGRADATFSAMGLFAADSTVVIANRVIGIGRAPGIFASSNSRNTEIAGNHVSGNTDGILVSGPASNTRVERNQAMQNLDDGIDVDSPSTTVAGNFAANNGDLGIEAVAGVVDGGGNQASGNGNPAQCTPAVSCS